MNNNKTNKTEVLGYKYDDNPQPNKDTSSPGLPAPAADAEHAPDAAPWHTCVVHEYVPSECPVRRETTA